MTGTVTVEDLQGMIGKEVGVSDWKVIDQARINAFADVTEDWQFIHVDPERAARETPFGGTIAHGYLTLSMLSAFSYDVMPRIEGVKMGINYGLNKVRFLTPVGSGSRVRARFALKESAAKSATAIMNVYDVTVEIDGSDKPALIAEWVTMVFV